VITLDKKYGVILKEDTPLPFSTINDRDDELLIFDQKEQIEIDVDTIEEEFQLIQLKTPKVEMTFTDYGFTSNSDQYYLYSELVSAFTIASEKVENIKMALFQIQEHLIATDTMQGQPVYFVDKKLAPLVEKYQHAYEVKILFLT
jgi:DNA polymerase III sliding clamp (beta) subunit (PCNA family)